MRFLHTADWHLGRLFHQVHLTEDQDHVLRQLVEVARDARVDAVVVAGDVYDRAVPPPEAVRLLDDVLAELLLGAEESRSSWPPGTTTAPSAWRSEPASCRRRASTCSACPSPTPRPSS